LGGWGVGGLGGSGVQGFRGFDKKCILLSAISVCFVREKKHPDSGKVGIQPNKGAAVFLA